MTDDAPQNQNQQNQQNQPQTAQNTADESPGDIAVSNTDAASDPDDSHVGDFDVMAKERLLTLYEAGSITREEFMQKSEGTPPEEYDSHLGGDNGVEPAENTVERQPQQPSQPEPDADTQAASGAADDGTMRVALEDEATDADPSDFDGDDDVVAETQQQAAQNKQARDEGAPSSLEEVNRVRKENGLDPVGGASDTDQPLAEDRVERQSVESEPAAVQETQASQTQATTAADPDPTPEERGYTDSQPVAEAEDIQDPVEAETELEEPMAVPNDGDVDDEELRDALEDAGVDPDASPMSDVDGDVPEDFNYEEQEFEDALGSGHEPGEIVHKELDGIVFRFKMPTDNVVYDILENAIADPSKGLKERNNYVIQRIVTRPDFTPQQWANHTSPIQRGIIASEAIEFAGIDQLGNYLAG